MQLQINLAGMAGLIMELFKDIVMSDYFHPEIISTFAEINQSRSEYQIDKFVLGQHATQEMRYYQCVLELQGLYYSLKQNSLNIKKTELEIKKLRESGNEIEEIDAQIKELGLEQTRSTGVGALREFEILLKKFNEFPKYTRQQIDEAQPEYWQRRLVRQYELSNATNGASQAAHLDALFQIGVIEMIPDSGIQEVPQQIDSFVEKEIE